MPVTPDSQPARKTRGSTVKADLLDAAIVLLNQHGPTGATARAICQQVGVKQPALYHHYGQLDQLHQAAATTVFQQIAHYYAPIDGVDLPLQRIEKSWDLFNRFAHQNPHLYQMINQQIIAGKLPAVVENAFDRLVTDLTSLADDKQLQITPAQAAQLLWAGANGAATLMAAASKRSDIDTSVARLMLDSLLATILKPKK